MPLTNRSLQVVDFLRAGHSLCGFTFVLSWPSGSSTHVVILICRRAVSWSVCCGCFSWDRRLRASSTPRTTTRTDRYVCVRVFVWMHVYVCVSVCMFLCPCLCLVGKICNKSVLIFLKCTLPQKLGLIDK